MSGPVDKKNIKKINAQIKKFENNLKDNEVSSDVLKGIIGKRGILEACCALGNNKETDFHVGAKKCRLAYKNSKFASIQKHMDSIVNNGGNMIKGADKLQGLSNRVNEYVSKIQDDIMEMLINNRKNFINAHSNLKLEYVEELKGLKLEGEITLIKQSNSSNDQNEKDYYLFKVDEDKEEENWGGFYRKAFIGTRRKRQN